MTVNYTTLLGLATPLEGTEMFEWGDIVNNEITSLLEDAVANASTFSVTSGNVTLTTTNGASNQARMSTLIITGTPGTTRNVVAPSQAKIYQVINQSNSSVVIKGSATTGVTIPTGATATVVWNGSDFVEINATSSGRIIDGNLQVTGNLQIDGNTQLGNATSDTLAVTALVNSNLLFTDATYDIGASGATRPRNLFLSGNATVGGTLGVTGAATLSANPTLSAGTANGVAYLNGSKVLTTGSALQFDGSNLGIGVTPSFSAAQALQVSSGAVIYSGSVTQTILGNNWYSNSGDKFLGTGYAALYHQSNGIHVWKTSATSGTAGNAAVFTNLMTLDTSGNLAVNASTNASYKALFKTSVGASSAIGTLGTSGDTSVQAILVTKYDNDSTTAQNFIQFQINNGAANCGKITANGANTAAFSSTSDRRVKENIVDLSPQLANICALHPVEFDYIESYGSGHQLGFIAQEMQAVYPDAVSGDGSDENILAITGWSKTEARLVKAIQEQQAIIEQLKARLDSITNI